MPRFFYIATDSTGMEIRGELIADHEEAARMELIAAHGLKVVEIKPADPEPESPALSRQASEELAHQLADLTAGDLPLETGLRMLAVEMGDFLPLKQNKTRQQLNRLAYLLEQGMTLDEALDRQGAPADLVAAIRAGMKSGQTGRALTQYVTYVKTLSTLRSRIALGFAYPVMLFSVGLALFLGLMIFIVPDFKEIFMGFGLELPAMTMMTLMMSDAAVSLVNCIAYPFGLLFGMVTLSDFSWEGVVLWAIIVAVIFVLYMLRKLMPSVLKRRLQLAVPVFGSILNAVSMSRFVHSLGFLTENEVPMSESLRLAGKSSGDPLIERTAAEWSAALERGESFEESARRIRGIPHDLFHSVQWQSDSTFLARALHSLGEMYEARARLIAMSAVSLSEPLVVLMVGLGFGWVVISMFYPLIRLLNALS